MNDQFDNRGALLTGIPQTRPTTQDPIKNPGIFDDDFAKTLKELVEDYAVDERIKKIIGNNPIWAGLMKTIKLTFLDEVDVFVMRHQFEEMVCSFISSIPQEDYTPQVDLMIQNLRMLFRANIKRSVGTTSGAINERIAILTAIRHQTSVITDKIGGNRFAGVGRLFGRKR